MSIVMDSSEHRFETSKIFDGPAGNNYTELTVLREEERLNAIRRGLIDDPSKPKALEDARVFRGTCLDMCPMYEREQREFQNDVKRWEVNPKTGRIDKDLAVKAFHRPAAGNEQALPSDVRPPEVLASTLDYLVQRIVSANEPLDKDTHGFVRDRTRSIRQDFTLQNERGSLAIACHERIVRFHILSLHQMCGIDGFDAHQEMEQLRKTLQSLAEYYDDQRHDLHTHEHEAEFRAYHIITRLRDPDVLRHVQTLPKHIRKDPVVSHALRLYKYAQRSNEEVGRFKPPNSEGSHNAYTRFFQLIRNAQTSYAMACLCETQFNSVRKGALKSMRKAFIAAVKAPSVDELVTILGCDDTEEVELQCEQYGVIVRPDEDGVKRIILNKSSQFDESRPDLRQKFSENLVEFKRGTLSFADVIHGKANSKSSFPIAIETIQKRSTPADILESTRLALPTPQTCEQNAVVAPVQKTGTNPPFRKDSPTALHLVSQSISPREAENRRSHLLTSVNTLNGHTSFASEAEPSMSFDNKISTLEKEDPISVFQEQAQEQKTIDHKAFKDIAKEEEQSNVIEELSQDLYINLVRNQVYYVACETYAEHWRELRDQRAAWLRLKATCSNVQIRRKEAAERALAEVQRHADYESAFKALHLKHNSTVSRKRGRSVSNIGGHASADSIREAQKLARRFWAPLDLEHLLLGIQRTVGSYPWSLLIALSSASSKEWMKTKFGLTDDTRTIAVRDQEFRLAITSAENTAHESHTIGALIFQISGEIDKDRQNFLILIQHIADETDNLFPILILAFDHVENDKLLSDLMVPQILSDRKSPVSFCNVVSIQTLEDITSFDAHLKEMLSHTTTRLSPLGIERAARQEQEDRISQPPVVPTTPETRAPTLRNSFYDTEIMRATPTKSYTPVFQRDVIPRQLSNLQDSVRKARELLARAAT